MAFSAIDGQIAGSNYSESLSGIETQEAIIQIAASLGSNYSESLSGIETILKLHPALI